MFAFDVDAKAKLWIGKNGTWEGGGGSASTTLKMLLGSLIQLYHQFLWDIVIKVLDV